jgi:alkylation response protein AidB-like acyl-CoA dehydrogenase
MATVTDRRFEELTAERILANAREMAPSISARSQEIEALRRLPEDLVADLRAAGFFRMGRSRAKGGPQMTLPQHLEVIEVLAHADPSVGWCVKIGTDSGLLAEFLPPAASARLLPDPDMITAGQFTTAHGTLERVADGSRLTGRTAAIDVHKNVELACSVGEAKRLADDHLQRFVREVSIESAAIHNDLA